MTARSASVVLSALLPAAALAQAPVSPQLATVFAQMDEAGKHFQSATADLERDNYERVVHETTQQKGTMFIDRGKAGIEFGATVSDVGAGAQANQGPSRVVFYTGGTLQMYTPAEKQVDVFKSGANQSKLEGYFALGFGATSHDLQNSWTITDLGPDTLSDGGKQIKVEKLLLVSKDPSVQNTFKRITLWLDPVRDISLKHLFETPSGDTQTAIYTNVKLNAKLNLSTYKIPTGKGITVVNH